MAIIVRLNNLLKSKRMSLKSFAQKIKVKEYNLLLLLSERKTIIKFSLLNKICKELQCQPGDIFWFCNKSQDYEEDSLQSM